MDKKNQLRVNSETRFSVGVEAKMISKIEIFSASRRPPKDW